MEKILVEIMIPASQKTYDMFIPLTSKMSDIITITSSLFSSLLEGTYKRTKDAMICDGETGHIYDAHLTVQELGLENGSRLMLI